MLLKGVISKKYVAAYFVKDAGGGTCLWFSIARYFLFVRSVTVFEFIPVGLCAVKELIKQCCSGYKRRTKSIKKAREDNGKVYSYSKIHDDLFDKGETCCPNQVARLALLAGIKAQISHERRPGTYGRKPFVLIDNRLNRQFNVDAQDTVRVTNITYIKTYESYKYLAFVINLYSLRVVGWSIQNRRTTDAGLQALLSAVR